MLHRYYTISGGVFQPESEDFLKKDIDLTELIPTGRANAISMRELSERLNVDTRTTRALIQQARANGAAICSDWENGGYYMPLHVGEAIAYLNQQRARIKSAEAALKGVEKYLQLFAVDDDVE